MTWLEDGRAFERAWLRSNHEGYPDPEWRTWAEAFAVALRLAREHGERTLVWRTSLGMWRVCWVGQRHAILRGARP